MKIPFVYRLLLKDTIDNQTFIPWNQFSFLFHRFITPLFRAIKDKIHLQNHKDIMSYDKNIYFSRFLKSWFTNSLLLCKSLQYVLPKRI